MTDDDFPDTQAPPPPGLTEPLHDLAQWTRYFRDAEIPVLAATSAALEALRLVEDDVDASMLTDVIQRDPLMTSQADGACSKQAPLDRYHRD
jgi:hypothetical protein